MAGQDFDVAAGLADTGVATARRLLDVNPPMLHLPRPELTADDPADARSGRDVVETAERAAGLARAAGLRCCTAAR